MTSKETEEKTPAALNGADWKCSAAKEFVAQCFIDGVLPLDKDELQDLDVEDACDNLFADRDEFKKFPFREDIYEGRLERLRDAISRRQGWAHSDHVALMNDRKVFPVRTHNAKGEINWKWSEADYWLKVDMEDDLHLEMKPQKLWATRACYRLFSKKRFSKRIDQYKEAAKEYGCTPGQNKSKKKKNLKKLGNPALSMLLLENNDNDDSSDEDRGDY